MDAFSLALESRKQRRHRYFFAAKTKVRTSVCFDKPSLSVCVCACMYNVQCIPTCRSSRLRQRQVDPFLRFDTSRSPPCPRDPPPSEGRGRSLMPPGFPCDCRWRARTTSIRSSLCDLNSISCIPEYRKYNV